MNTCPTEFKPKIWLRYVDDVFEVVKRDKIQELTEHLNQADDSGNIKFTVEVEEDGKLPVLDVLMTTNDDGSVKT